MARKKALPTPPEYLVEPRLRLGPLFGAKVGAYVFLNPELLLKITSIGHFGVECEHGSGFRWDGSGHVGRSSGRTGRLATSIEVERYERDQREKNERGQREYNEYLRLEVVRDAADDLQRACLSLLKFEDRIPDTEEGRAAIQAAKQAIAKSQGLSKRAEKPT